MILSETETIRLHREMWNWIAKETEETRRKVTKKEWFDKFMPTKTIQENCFCCEYSFTLKTTCEECLINWPGIDCIDNLEIDDENGLFSRWYRAKTWQKAAELAKQIAELPERGKRGF